MKQDDDYFKFKSAAAVEPNLFVRMYMKYARNVKQLYVIRKSLTI